MNTSAASASPFWSKTNEKNSNNFWPIFKKVLKYFKFLVFAFLMTMGLWGCFQTMWDPTISTDSAIGAGIEFGYDYGTTGNNLYDLAAASMFAQYHSFTTWSMEFGPFYGLFVWPGSKLVLDMMYGMRELDYGINTLISLFVLLLMIRILSIFVSLKSTLQNEKMVEVQGKLSEINAKYKDLKDPSSKQKKQQEIMDLYQKNKVKPFAAFEQMFITLPVFLIVFRVVTIVRPMKASVLFGIWNFAVTPLSSVFGDFVNGGWVYIFFLLLVVPIQFVSMKLPQHWAKKRNRNAKTISNKGDKQYRKMNMIQNIFMVLMGVIVAFSAVGVGVYWFFNSLFSIAQAYIMHRVILNSRAKKNGLEARLNRLILE